MSVGFRILPSPPRASDALLARLARMGSAAVPGTAAEFAQFIREEVPRWAGVVKKSGAKVD